MQYHKQNSVIRRKSNILTPTKQFFPPQFLVWLRYWLTIFLSNGFTESSKSSLHWLRIIFVGLYHGPAMLKCTGYWHRKATDVGLTVFCS